MKVIKAPRKVAIVTGASYGIGAATAIKLAESGFDLALTELEGRAPTETARKVTEAGGTSKSFVLDLQSQDSIDAMFSDVIDAYGSIDLLVNNAGAPSLRKPALDIRKDEWEQLMSVCLTGTFLVTQRMGQHLISSGREGQIINLASTHALVGIQGHSAYGIAKAGICQMTRMLAIEWAQHGIRLNAVAPGTTETETRAAVLQDKDRRAYLMDRIPLGRFAQAEEIAAAVDYLASPGASYMTGQVLVLDGGMTAA
ncbi:MULTISPECIES: SDR family NAD(P)-dependent oxidoreductase [Pacificibacter]|uniref:SDR family NAD(P)-dependent oxidoreductase n=1 Tax=Pacificibacter TaxID=1042323 RepID=UPI001C08DCD9|nr:MULTISPECIES: SDR family oxidoreductase [Pacificibacter]MBU2934557.1 SDR family oxidoreductase [Pacificibacter marinus]MDO6617321.1 SDR family oxidoreductase [Pacificibacter sp. 1_MG-2023]